MGFLDLFDIFEEAYRGVLTAHNHVIYTHVIAELNESTKYWCMQWIVNWKNKHAENFNLITPSKSQKSTC